MVMNKFGVCVIVIGAVLQLGAFMFLVATNGLGLLAVGVFLYGFGCFALGGYGSIQVETEDPSKKEEKK